MQPSFRGDRLEELRKSKNMTQRDLADLLEVTQKQISKYERGDGNPSVGVLIALADEFDTTTDYLLGRVHTQARTRSDTLTEHEYEILTLVQDRDEEFLQKLIAVLKIL